MLKIKKSFFFYFIILCFMNSVEAAEKIAFLDLDYVFNNSEPGNKIVKSLKDLNKKNIDKLKEKENLIKKKEDEIKQKQNVIAKEELLKDIDILKKDISEFRKYKETLVQDFNKKKSNDLSNFMKRITPIIENYMDNNSISIIIDKKNVYIANIEYDITNKLIEIINKKF